MLTTTGLLSHLHACSPFPCRYLLDHCKPDLEFIVKMVDKGAVERLEQVASSPFKRVSYTEAIDILKEVVASGKKKFEFAVRAGEVGCRV